MLTFHQKTSFNRRPASKSFADRPNPALWVFVLILFSNFWGLSQAQTVVAWGGLFSQTNVPPAATNVAAISAGLYHTLALRSDGMVVAWGSGTQTNVSIAATNVVQISAGYDHSLVLRGDGSVLGWGNPIFGKTTAPAAASNAVAVAAGRDHSLVLRADGSVFAWGSSSYGTQIPASVRNVKRIATAASSPTGGHHLALRDDGTVIAWGYSAEGRTNVPPSATNVVAIAAGGRHSLVLRTDGTVVAWGSNASGQSSVPVAASNVVSVAAGSTHSLALRADGTIVGWGDNGFGKAMAPAGVTNAIGMGAGGNYSVALLGDGAPRFIDSMGDVTAYVGRDFGLNALAVGMAPLSYQWSYNGEEIPGATLATLTLSEARFIDSGAYSVVVSNGQGVITGLVANVLVQIAPEAPLIQEAPQSQTVFAGTQVEFACVATGYPLPVFQWQFNGTNIAGATNATFSMPYVLPGDAGNYRVVVSNDLGVVTSQVATLAVSLPSSPVLTDWPADRVVSAGSPLTLSVAASGEEPVSYQWYFNNSLMQGFSGPTLTFGAVGLGDGGSYRVRASNASGTSLGPEFQLAVVPVAVWGSGPVTNLPATLSNAVAIAAGPSHAIALKADGTIAAWGTNTFGQLNVPADLTNAVAVAAGLYGNLALKSDGTVVGWGKDSGGQFSIPASATNVISIAAGDSFSLAVQAGGAVLGWGTNNQGQIDIPLTATSVVAVAAGASHALALRSDGTVVAWGSNSYGQLNVPSRATNIVAIAAGAYYSSALRKDGVLLMWGSSPYFLSGTALPFSPVGLQVNDVSAMAAGGSDGVVLHESGQLAILVSFTVAAATPPSWITNVVAVGQGSGFRLALVRPMGGLPLPQVTLRQSYLEGRAVFSGHTAGQRVGKYQWRFNGSNLPGATHPHLVIAPTHATQAGDYNVVVSDQAGSVISSTARLDVVAPPFPLFIQHPVSLTVGAGSTATFTAGTAAPTPVVFQWLFNDNPIPGATSSSLILTNVQSPQAGSYRVVAANLSGSITSEAATLTVTTAPPGFIIQPANRAAALSQSATFISLATGTEPIFYQWQFNETDIPDATNATLTVSLVTEAQAGMYRVVAGNAIESIISSNAVLAVVPVTGWGANGTGQLDVPATATNIISMAVGLAHVLALREDGTVTSWGTNSCGQTSGPAGASNIVRIAAGSVHSLALRSDGVVEGWGDGRFASIPPGLSNVVEIACGTAHSVAVKVDGTVLAWGNGFVGSTNVPAGLSNVVAVAAGAFHSIALLRDGTAVTWGSINHVPAQATNLVSVVAGQAYCAGLKDDGTIVAWGALMEPTGLVDSASCGGYSFSASGVDRTLPIQVPTEATNVVALAAGRHHLVALRADGQLIAWGDNSFGQSTVPSFSNGLGIFAGGNQTFVVEGSPSPRIAAFEAHRFAGEDSPVLLSAAAAGVWPLSFQWKRNDEVIDGATNSFVFLPRVYAQDSGEYTLEVFNSFGSATKTVSLAVSEALPVITSQPVSQVLATGEDVSMAVAAHGSGPLTYEWMRDGTPLSDGGNVSGTSSAVLQITGVTPANTGFYTVVVSNEVGSVTSSTASLYVFNSPLATAVDRDGTLWMTGGTAPWIWQNSTTKDGVDAAESGPHASAQTTWVETVISGPTAVWFWWKTSGWLTDRLSLQVNGVEQLAITYNTDWQQRSIFVPAGDHVLRWVFTCRNPFGESSAWLDQVQLGAPSPPSITTQPVSRTVAEGSAVTFAVTAQGTAPLVYAWQVDGTEIPGATRSSLTLSSTMSDAGNYRAWVSNAAGSLFSEEAALTVLGSAPVLQTGPKPVTAAPGTAARFDSVFAGSGPTSYQWQRNGSGVFESGSEVLVLSNVQQTDGGFYRVIASNPFGSTVSGEAPLTLVPVAAWGGNSHRESEVPADVGTVVALAAGSGNSIALRADGSISYWGAQSMYWLTPRPVVEDFVEVASRGSAHLGLRADGTVAAWGGNDWGQSNPPANISNCIAIAMGSAHALAVRADGAVVAWGAISDVTATNCISVAAGSGFSLALREDGTVLAWGFNSHGQADVPPDLTDVVAIKAGARHALALRADGTVEAWGLNDFGQATVPAGLTNVVAISAGDYHNLALRADGKVVAWGLASDGRIDVSPTLENVVAISAGQSHSLALVGDGSPAITIHPTARRHLMGNSARLNVFATGAGSLEYQWQLDGTDIDGATNAWHDAQTAGIYRVIVQNALGATASREAVVTAPPTPGPPGFVNSTVLASPSGRLFRTTLTGLTGEGLVVIQASTNLVNWQAVATNQPVAGQLVLEQIIPEEDAAYFYRAVEER